MTPEERAATVLVPLGNWFASNPKVVAGVATAIRNAERAAYERARQVALDYAACKTDRHANSAVSANTAINISEEILALIDKVL
jgi:hypothetical protein